MHSTNPMKITTAIITAIPRPMPEGRLTEEEAHGLFQRNDTTYLPS